MKKQMHSPAAHKHSKSALLEGANSPHRSPKQPHPRVLGTAYHPEYHPRGTFYAIKKAPVEYPCSPPRPHYLLRYSHFDSLKTGKKTLRRLKASYGSGQLRVIPTGSPRSRMVSFQFYSPAVSKPVSPPNASLHESRVISLSSSHVAFKTFDTLNDLKGISLMDRLTATDLGLTRHRSPDNTYVRLSRTARSKRNRMAA